jgi:hypothetical protein
VVLVQATQVPLWQIGFVPEQTEQLVPAAPQKVALIPA